MLRLDGTPITPAELLARIPSDVLAKANRIVLAEQIRGGCAEHLEWICGDLVHGPEISSFSCLTEPEQPAGRVIFESGGIIRIQRFAPTPEDEHA